MILFFILLQQLCFTIAYVPQILRLYSKETKNTEVISVPYYAIRIFGLITLQLVYMLQHDTALALTNLSGIFLEIIILNKVWRGRNV
jgi:lipid-A-disaccharide synthase-like uncharacterized protein